MNERYEIRIHGLLGPLLRTSFDDLSCESLPSQSTIRAKLSAAELERLLLRLDQSGVELVHLDCG
ncbi:hypothetical protein [Paractinoplanes rishiriensis]|uniref:Uncharacterized protein n=1 Tax=Paractinoplanes rishiriensis TaxID=1050105 RepID=A0A919K2V6_9ACTN|nr:hypothetical protein [Actinoplanes rishiriensis]GIE98474.1 hypothetical protein Ari01nite_59390 [Actinoplanes rishiriensis]